MPHYHIYVLSFLIYVLWIQILEQSVNFLNFQIISLSADRRTFVRAPPTGVTFDFDYASVSSTALALLKEDPKVKY